MIIIACIDERKGMMFNHRRQSRDRAVYEDILKECKGKTLYMTAYSRDLFEKNDRTEIIVSEDMLQQAEADSLCFIEDTKITGYEDKIHKVILYQWNRHYPADTYFSMELSGSQWQLMGKEAFQGSSHELICKEVYQRRVKE